MVGSYSFDDDPGKDPDHQQQDTGIGQESERVLVLVREANHRIANSLTLAAAFVDLQMRDSDDPLTNDALSRTRVQIDTIAELHRLLAIEGCESRIPMDDYLPKVIGALQTLWATPQTSRCLSLSCDRMDMEPQEALSISVITNELVTNACKHAYPQGLAGRVEITLARPRPNQFLLVVADHGTGLGLSDASVGHGLGSAIIDRLVSSLGATMHVDSSAGGTRITICGQG